MNRLDNYREWGTTILRLTVGIVFVMHGYQKLFVWGLGGVTQGFAGMGLPAPQVSAILATTAEALGGLLILLGLFTRYAAIPVAFTMIVAIFAVHFHEGFFGPKGYEYPLTLLGANLALVFLGSGNLALDNLIHHHGVDRPQTPIMGRPVGA